MPIQTETKDPEPTSPDIPEVWEQQEGENTKTYSMFCLYRDYGPTRSLRKVYNKYKGIELDCQLNTFITYSGTNGWEKRAHAYDSYILAKELEDNEELIRNFNKRRGEEALKLMDQAFEMMKQDIELGQLQPKENRERYKMGFEIFRAINRLDKDNTRVEHSGKVNIVFGDELKDV